MDVFVARQPIFDRAGQVYGYELLYRSSMANGFDNTQENLASLRVIANSLAVLGLERMTGRTRAFINFGRELLLSDYPLLLPASSVVIELLENIAPDAEVLQACRALREQGYVLALDDVCSPDLDNPLLGVVQIVKVDLQLAAPDTWQRLAALAARYGVRLLAEKVETRDVYREVLAMGYEYFQGYFFSKPEVLPGRSVAVAQANSLRLLQLVSKAEIDVDEVARALQQDVGLAYKLLRFLNSAFVGLRHRISNTRQAVLMLGQSGIRRWTSMIVLADLGGERSGQALIYSIVRARFCESLAERSGLADRRDDLYLLGLFSLIDVLLGQPLEEILAALPLAADVSRALLGQPSPIRPLYDLVLAYERADWEQVVNCIGALGLAAEDVQRAYCEALEWADESAAASAAA
ncbi:MAG TPA: EAL domain-containing protein [Chloroflexota bacterium]|nr:EAL domain-containing protein [Chloroflexota bacterium]